jgi:hypothetical protein
MRLLGGHRGIDRHFREKNLRVLISCTMCSI